MEKKQDGQNIWSKEMFTNITGKQSKAPKPAYLIINTVTNRPYIDELRRAYAFSSRDAAEDFAEKVGRVSIRKSKKGMTISVMSDCYAAGARTLIEREKGRETKHTLQEESLKRRHYNSELSADESRYIMTRQPDYIRSMGCCRFIVPVRIRNHPEMSVEYATALIPDMPYKYLAFTDLEEYGKWRRNNDGWAPLEVRADVLGRIGKRHGFLLDACGAKLLISKGMLAEIIAESKKGKEVQDA